MPPIRKNNNRERPRDAPGSGNPKTNRASGAGFCSRNADPHLVSASFRFSRTAHHARSPDSLLSSLMRIAGLDRVGILQCLVIGDPCRTHTVEQARSKVSMPSSRDLAMNSLIAGTSPLKIRSDISGEFSRISISPRAPLAALLRISAARSTALMFSDRSSAAVRGALPGRS